MNRVKSNQMNVSKRRLGNRVVSIRKSLGWTQLRCAEQAGISLRNLQEIENAGVDVKLSTIDKLAAAFGVEAFQLICVTTTESVLDSRGVSKAENASSKNSHFLMAVPFLPLDEFSVGIQVCDRFGLIRYVNRKCTKIHGFSSDEICGKKYIWDMTFQDKHKSDLQKYFKFLLRERPDPMPYIGFSRRKDGSKIKLRVNWNYIIGAAGEVEGFISFIEIEK